MSTETPELETTNQPETAPVVDTVKGEWTETAEGYQTTFTDGTVVQILRGKGKHIKQAVRVMGKPENYQTALQALLIQINGKHKVIEDFEPWYDELLLKDAQILTTKFAEVNFL